MPVTDWLVETQCFIESFSEGKTCFAATCSTKLVEESVPEFSLSPEGRGSG